MKHDTDKDAIVTEIMEAGLLGALGGAAYAGGKALAKGAVAAGKAGAKAALNATGNAGALSRLKGGVQAGRALTKIQDDWNHYAGAHGLTTKTATEADLMAFAHAAYGIDATPAMEKAKASVGLNAQPAASNSAQPQQTAQPQQQAQPQGAAEQPQGAAEQPQAAPQGQQQAAPEQPQPQAQAQPQAAPEANPAAGRAKKADASAPQAEPAKAAGPEVVGKPGKRYVRADGSPVDPNDVVATPPDGKDGERPYKHDSSRINFDDPEFQKPLRSSGQQRDDQRQGGGKKRRNESLELPFGTFSEILAERETSAVNSQAVPNAQQNAALANAFFKVLAATAASTPRMFRAFMNNEHNDDPWGADKRPNFKSTVRGDTGTARPSGNQGSANQGSANQGAGQQGNAGKQKPAAPPNNSTGSMIDKNYLNHMLETEFEISPKVLSGLKAAGQKLEPEQLVQFLNAHLSPEDAKKFIAAVLLTVK
jgi:hypothetical protein